MNDSNGMARRYHWLPFPVDRATYDRTVDVLRAAVSEAGIERSERVAALKRLVKFGER